MNKGAGIGALVGDYFLWPAFQDFIDQAYQVITSNEKERISS